MKKLLVLVFVVAVLYSVGSSIHKDRDLAEKRKIAPEWIRDDCNLLQSYFDTVEIDDTFSELKERADECGLYVYDYSLHEEYDDRGLQVSMTSSSGSRGWLYEQNRFSGDSVTLYFNEDGSLNPREVCLYRVDDTRTITKVFSKDNSSVTYFAVRNHSRKDEESESFTDLRDALDFVYKGL